MNIQERALESCLEYDAVKRQIDDLTDKIGTHVHSCLKNSEVWHELSGRKPEEGSEDPCLFEVYDERSRRRINNTWPEYDGIDYESSHGMCEECTQAHEAIQDRKKLRQRFGVAKRKVRAVARAYKKSNNKTLQQ